MSLEKFRQTASSKKVVSGELVQRSEPSKQESFDERPVEEQFAQAILGFVNPEIMENVLHLDPAGRSVFTSLVGVSHAEGEFHANVTIRSNMESSAKDKLVKVNWVEPDKGVGGVITYCAGITSDGKDKFEHRWGHKATKISQGRVLQWMADGGAVTEGITSRLNETELLAYQKEIASKLSSSNPNPLLTESAISYYVKKKKGSRVDKHSNINPHFPPQ